MVALTSMAPSVFCIDGVEYAGGRGGRGRAAGTEGDEGGEGEQGLGSTDRGRGGVACADSVWGVLECTDAITMSEGETRGVGRLCGLGGNGETEYEGEGEKTLN